MTKSIRWTSLLAVGLTAGLVMTGCGDDVPSDTSADTGTGTSGDGDGDPTTGDGDGDPTTGDGDGDPTTGDGDGDPTTGDGDGDPTTGDGDGDPTTGDGDGDPTTGDGDGDPNAICGNGMIEGDEVCDDGNTNNNDGCLGDCLAVASCGDSYVNEGVEACDDGVNDGSYGGCAVDCLALAAYCGDGEINGMEACDDANADSADGCLASCVIPGSCLDLLDYDDQLMDGGYKVAPPGYNGDAFDVYCDMLTDDGGYTFLKVDAGGQENAAQAEAECANWGMQLWIPRSESHQLSGWAIANDGNIGPGGDPNYMRILGIYPSVQGATCLNQPMNSNNANCGWGSSDGEVWWVHERNDITEPNGDNSVDGSMQYTWNIDGTIQWHNDIGGAGYLSQFYMCDVGDKLP